MPQPPDWKRVLEAGVQFTELRRSQAQRLASDLVAQGQLARDQVGAAVDELIEMSRHRSEELRQVVRGEVQRQLGALGLATKQDLVALERRLRVPPPTAKRKAPARKVTKPKKATRAPASTARKPAAKKSPARTARKPARKATAKRAR